MIMPGPVINFTSYPTEMINYLAQANIKFVFNEAQNGSIRLQIADKDKIQDVLEVLRGNYSKTPKGWQFNDREDQTKNS